MDSPLLKAPTSPKAPLLPVSPERINQRKTSSSSEVPAKVPFINSLSRNENNVLASHSSTTSAALQRAILGREEAEAALAKVTSQLSEAQARERRISERLESLSEELQATKQRQAQERAVFEKEVRKARKEAFRASSNLVKLQEDLKLCREENKSLREEVKAEREAKEKAQQEASESASALAKVTAEKECLRDEVRVEREAKERVQQEASESASTLAVLSEENKGLRDELRLEREAKDKAQKEASENASTLSELTAENKSLKDEVRVEREAKEKAQKEAFESASALNALTEELNALKEKLRSFEAERQMRALEAHAEETQLQNSGKLPLAQAVPASLTPAHQGRKRGADDIDDAEWLVPEPGSVQYGGEVPPKKQKLSPRASPKNNQDAETPSAEKELIEDLRWELQWERQLRIKAEDMVDFLKMECQFKRCSCRLAEKQGTNYVHDVEWDKRQKAEQLEGEVKSEKDGNAFKQMQSRSTPGTPVQESTAALEGGSDWETAQEMETRDGWVTTFSPKTGTFRTVPSPARESVKRREDEPLVLSEPSEQHFQSSVRKLSPQPTASISIIEADHQYSEQHRDVETLELKHAPQFVTQTPAGSSLRSDQRLQPRQREPSLERETERSMETRETVTVKTVPLRPEGDDTPNKPFANIPGTPISREEALAQIRARRDRARSTSKRSTSDSESSMRSGGMGMTPIRGVRRIPGFQNTDTKNEGDLVERRHLGTPASRF